MTFEQLTSDMRLPEGWKVQLYRGDEPEDDPLEEPSIGEVVTAMLECIEQGRSHEQSQAALLARTLEALEGLIKNRPIVLIDGPPYNNWIGAVDNAEEVARVVRGILDAAGEKPEAEVEVKQPLEHTLQVQVSSDEFKALRTMAEEEGVPLFTMVRTMILREANDH